MDWFRSVILFITIVSFLQWITPGGSMEKYIKYVLSLVTLAVVLSPLKSDGAVTASLELPQGAIAGDGGFQSSAETILKVQEYQWTDVLSSRIQQEASKLLNPDFPGISEDDVNVYIEQGALEDGGVLSCVIVVHVMDLRESEKVRKCLEQGLGQTGIMIRVTGKEQSNESGGSETAGK